MEAGALPRKVLVVGARGFLGEHIVQQLADAGCDVLAAMRSGDEWGFASGQVRILAGDLCDVALLRRALDQVDAACFVAGRTWQPDLDVSEYHRQNVALTEAFFE